jgi:tetratricopeptide (TPR) repeat protein
MRQLETGDARTALAGFESVLRQVPIAPIEALITRARDIVADQQARDDRLRSLLAEATDAQASGRLQAALALIEQAVVVQPQSIEARQLLARLQRDAAAADLEKTRRCERYLARARRALQLEQFDETDRQLLLATETGAANADIAAVTAALQEARAAHDNAGALVQEISAELARARSEFQMGHRHEAIARLEALASRHPSSTASTAELARLRAADERFVAAQQSQSDADRLAGEAAAALTAGDASTAAQLAEQALALVPSHEPALRTSAVASAQLREVTERAARIDRARQILDEARALLASGLFDRAIKEARTATELDPSGTAAPAVIAEAFRRRADAAAAEAAAQETVRRAAEVAELLTSAAAALRNKEFARARTLGERALAVDPEDHGPREFITKVAAAAALAASAIEEDTVDLQKGEVDPEATAVLPPVTGATPARPSFAQRLWSGLRARGWGGRGSAA